MNNNKMILSMLLFLLIQNLMLLQKNIKKCIQNYKNNGYLLI